MGTPDFDLARYLAEEQQHEQFEQKVLIKAQDLSAEIWKKGSIKNHPDFSLSEVFANGTIDLCDVVIRAAKAETVFDKLNALDELQQALKASLDSDCLYWAERLLSEEVRLLQKQAF